MRFYFNFLIASYVLLLIEVCNKNVNCKRQTLDPIPNVELQILERSNDREVDRKLPRKKLSLIILAPEMMICKRYASDRDSCIKKSITNLLPILKNGYPPLGIRPIEPFVSDLIHFKYDTGILKINMKVTNATTHGLSNTRIRGVKSEVTDKTLKIFISITHPKTSVESMFQGLASLNDFKVDSAGFQNVSMTDVRAVWRLVGEVETVNGEDYMIIKEVDVKPRIGNMKYAATGLFPDPDLNQFTVEFINQNWQYLVEQFFPVTKQAWEPIMLELTNNIFGKVPYNRLLPKD